MTYRKHKNQKEFIQNGNLVNKKMLNNCRDALATPLKKHFKVFKSFSTYTFKAFLHLLMYITPDDINVFKYTLTHTHNN